MSIDLATLTATDYANGALRAQVKLLGNDSSCAPGLMYHPFGFVGRPKDPDVDSLGNVTKGATALFWYEGNTLHTMALGDPRRTSKLPTVDKGGSCQYADCDNAYGLFGADGTYTLRVPTGKTASIGDSSAQALALGAALTSLVTGLRAFTAATKAASIEPSLGPASTALDVVVQAITQIQTTMLKGT